MPDIESLLTRWQSAGVLDAATAARIRAHESQSASKDSPGLKWQGITALILGAILLACGVVLFISAHWDQLGPAARFTLVCAMVAVFHIAGGFARPKFLGLSTALHAVGTVATGAAIALVGQIFNIQEHWPAAVLLWALAALAGWVLLRDQAQQTLALLLVPAWIFCELSFRMSGHIGEDVYMGRILFAWAILYITFFIASKRKAVQGILFALSVIGAVTGIVIMLSSWQSWNSNQSFIPFGTRVWAWIAIAAIPLIIAAFHGHKGLTPHRRVHCLRDRAALVLSLDYRELHHSQRHHKLLGPHRSQSPCLRPRRRLRRLPLLVGRAPRLSRARQPRHRRLRRLRRVVLLQ